MPLAEYCSQAADDQQSPFQQSSNVPPNVKDALGVAVVKYDLKPLQEQLELMYAGERFVIKIASMVSADCHVVVAKVVVFGQTK